MHVKHTNTATGNSTAARIAVVVGLGLLLLACQPRVDARGHITDPDALRTVAVGVHNQDDVRYLLGSPSAVSTFGGDVWYYISERTESVAFFKPKVLERQVIAISFTDGDDKVVKEIARYDKSDAREIELVDRRTPTAGNETTLLQDLFGNFGRFTRPAGPQ